MARRDLSNGTYWGGNGLYEATNAKLETLVPTMGEVTEEHVPEGKRFKKLEIFRKASNAYHDLFNNGGGNACRKTAHYFPGCITLVNSGRHRDGRIINSGVWEECYKITEPIMDRIIVMAALEQGIPILSNSNHSHREL